MSIPLNADSDFWIAQDFALRILNELWNRGGDRAANPEKFDDYLERRQQLLAALAYVDPKGDEWQVNDALYPPGKNPFRPFVEEKEPGDRGFDVVS